MKINQIESFIKNPKFNNILIFGQDYGVIRNRLDIMVKYIMENHNIAEKNIFQYSSLDVSSIKEKTDNLDFFSSKSLIIIEECSSVLKKSLKEIIEQNKDSFLIFVASDLPPSSSWRKFFESSKTAASIACYSLDRQSLKSYILKSLQQENLSITLNALDFLCDNISGDFLYSQNSIEKLILYMSQSNYSKIDLIDVEKTLSDPINEEIDDLCKYVMCDDNDNFQKIFSKLIKAGVFQVSIIRFLTYYLHRLLIVKHAVESGESIDKALSLLRPPIFFKQKASFVRNLNVAKSSQIINKIKYFNEVEKMSKKNQTLAISMMSASHLQV